MALGLDAEGRVWGLTAYGDGVYRLPVERAKALTE